MRIVDAIVVVETATRKCAIRVALLCSSAQLSLASKRQAELDGHLSQLAQLMLNLEPLPPHTALPR